MNDNLLCAIAGLILTVVTIGVSGATLGLLGACSVIIGIGGALFATGSIIKYLVDCLEIESEEEEDPYDRIGK